MVLENSRLWLDRKSKWKTCKSLRIATLMIYKLFPQSCFRISYGKPTKWPRTLNSLKRVLYLTLCLMFIKRFDSIGFGFYLTELVPKNPIIVIDILSKLETQFSRSVHKTTGVQTMKPCLHRGYLIIVQIRSSSQQ